MIWQILLRIATMTIAVSAVAIGATPAFAQSSTGQITVLYDAFGRTSKTEIPRMNPELGPDGSGFLGLPEGAALLVAGRLQSGPGVAFLGPKCLVFLGVWPQSSRSGALGRMTIGRLTLVQAATSAAVRRSAAKSPGTVAGEWRPRPSGKQCCGRD